MVETFVVGIAVLEDGDDAAPVAVVVLQRRRPAVTAAGHSFVFLYVKHQDKTSMLLELASKNLPAPLRCARQGWIWDQMVCTESQSVPGVSYAPAHSPLRC